MQEDHQLAIAERDIRIQAIYYKNVGLQQDPKVKDQKIRHLFTNRYVRRCGEYHILLVSVEKNEDHGKAGRYLYYIKKLA